VTNVHLGAFDGPLGLLLALIETRELDVLSVPLGDLAEGFLDAVAGEGNVVGERLASLSGFVAIAAQLILIKSRALLPGPPAAAETPGTLGRTIAVEERAAFIREALRAAPVVVLQDLLRGVRDRVVAAVTFLAMLELVKRREITVEQAEPWGEIVCRRLA